MTADLRQQLQALLGADYAIERELGGGGMSRVFLAEERRLGRRVVVKVLSPELGAGLSADRFDREIRLAAQLQDPRIVPLLQTGHDAGLQYYTMPYIEGETLRARLARSRVPLEESIEILRDVLLALEYAHARDVVHRDIKPDNILLTGRTALVADFGIAKAVTAATQPATGATTLTEMGTIVGTPAYMAPEQAAGDRVDPRADLYAWGVIAYEMLNGAHPFASRTTAQALLAAHISEAPTRLVEARRDLPAGVATLVDRCLAKDPNLRPADASAALAALNSAMKLESAGGFRLAPAHIAAAIAALAVLGAGGAWIYQRSEHRRWAQNDAVREAAALRSSDRSLAGFLLLKKAERYLPADTQIAHAIANGTRTLSIASTPSGATVSIQDYLAPDSAAYVLGTTPLQGVRIPRGYFRWRVSKAGMRDYVAAPFYDPEMRFELDSAQAAPAGMVKVDAGQWADWVAFVGFVGPYDLPAFYLDRLEVTNRAYQAFVDSGGYTTPRYWTEKFMDHGRELARNEAMTRFRDRTGRPGPATWEGGRYPEGQGDYPVSGLSWYEASAYAAFVGKTLPTFAQWYQAAPPDLAGYIVQKSNISQAAPAPAGTFSGLGPYGTLDMAGGVREWILNSVDGDRRFALGGAWSSQSYLYASPEALSPFDRSPENGVRCLINTGPVPVGATAPIKVLERDFASYRPANDDVFRAYRAMYAYDKTPLNAKAEGEPQQTADWTKEKVTFDAAYGNERLAAYVFLPKRVRPPYQTIVFFPSARVENIPNSSRLGDTAFFDYVVQSGRAVVYPVFQDTYERRIRNGFPLAGQSRTIAAQRSKDLERTIDYLETRPDIAANKLGYMGVSMGAAEGVIYATLAQDRLKAVVFLDGGYFLSKPPVGGDQADFAPRLKTPTLMVNGRYDFSFAYERAQLPLYRALGAAAADKRHAVLETPHDVRADRANLVKEVLAWLDKYLGRVQ